MPNDNVSYQMMIFRDWSV